jgi:hypothetical protein
MSSSTTSRPEAHHSSPHPRGRRGHKNRQTNAGTGSSRNLTAIRGKVQSASPPSLAEEQSKIIGPIDAAVSASAGVDEAVCWICAEPVKYYSTSECDHRTCHVCTLRLRALYKKTECTFCKASLSVSSCRQDLIPSHLESPSLCHFYGVPRLPVLVLHTRPHSFQRLEAFYIF